ncbi:mucus binding protein, partial [Leuconostoc citreum]|nr:mucus binding protein [Leuconostoc citreum]MCT3061356.1 mucus binding protein [Leuconostoc citreum]
MKGRFFVLKSNYFGETKTHYKLYKCGKNWAVMAISVFSLGLGMLVTSRPVSADVAATSTSSIAVRAETTSASSSSAVKADSTSANNSSAVKAETTSASSSSATKAETTGAISSSAVKADSTSANNSSAVKAETTGAISSSAVKVDSTSENNSSAVNAETTSAISSSATKAETTGASSSSATKADSTSANNSSAVNAETTSASSSSAVKTETTSASSSSATNADSANATSTNEYSASASNLSKTGAASTSNSTEVKTNAKYENSVETVDNNKRGNRENTHSINQRRIVKRSAIVTTKFAQNYGRKVLSGSVTNTGFSVSDPDYPSGMWIDPDKSHYSYEWLQTYSGNQIVLSTNRTGDGIVYVTELSSSNAVLKQYTLNQNTKVPSAVFNSTTYYNDTYSAMVESSRRDPLAVKYLASKYDSGYYNKLSYIVPKLITQTTYYVDKDGKQITDSNGNLVVAYTQKGLVGQNYTTSNVNVINGYYATAPSNSNGVMSPYGEIGASYVKDFHDGIVVTYTQTGSDGTMSASIAQDGKVLNTWTNIKPSDPAIMSTVGSTTVAIKNPYIPQTSDVKYVYRKLGNWVVSNPDGSTKSIIYPNDPIDPTKIADSSVPGYPVIDFLPGYTPEDHMGTPLVPVDPDDRTKGYIPPIPSDNGTDTTITYTADKQQGSVSYVDDKTGETLKTDS